MCGDTIFESVRHRYNRSESSLSTVRSRPGKRDLERHSLGARNRSLSVFICGKLLVLVRSTLQTIQSEDPELQGCNFYISQKGRKGF